MEIEASKEVVVPGRGGLMKRTLKELEMLKINLKDIFLVSGVSFNLGWDQIIRLINYNAEKKVLNWEHTFEEALEMIKLFLL